MRVKEWQGNKRPLELGYRAMKYQINECDCCKERATRSKTQNCQKKNEMAVVSEGGGKVVMSGTFFRSEARPWEGVRCKGRKASDELSVPAAH
jgi:hypothetical protein